MAAFGQEFVFRMKMSHFMTETGNIGSVTTNNVTDLQSFVNCLWNNGRKFDISRDKSSEL